MNVLTDKNFTRRSAMYKDTKIEKIKDDILYFLISELNSLRKRIINKKILGKNYKDDYKKAKKIKRLINIYLI